MDSTQAKQIVRTLIADMERLHVSKLKTALDDARCARDLSPGKMESTDEIRQRIKSLFINSATKILTTRDKAEWPGAIDALKDKINYMRSCNNYADWYIRTSAVEKLCLRDIGYIGERDINLLQLAEMLGVPESTALGRLNSTLLSFKSHNLSENEIREYFYLSRKYGRGSAWHWYITPKGAEEIKNLLQTGPIGEEDITLQQFANKLGVPYLQVFGSLNKSLTDFEDRKLSEGEQAQFFYQSREPGKGCGLTWYITPKGAEEIENLHKTLSPGGKDDITLLQLAEKLEISHRQADLYLKRALSNFKTRNLSENDQKEYFYTHKPKPGKGRASWYISPIGVQEIERLKELEVKYNTKRQSGKSFVR